MWRDGSGAENTVADVEVQQVPMNASSKSRGVALGREWLSNDGTVVKRRPCASSCQCQRPDHSEWIRDATRNWCHKAEGLKKESKRERKSKSG